MLESEKFSPTETTVTEEEYLCIAPLIKVISGRTSVSYNQELGGFVVIFQIFDELWVSLLNYREDEQHLDRSRLEEQTAAISLTA